MFADEQKIVEHCRAMNAGEMVPLFVGLLTARRWDQVTQRTATHLRLTGSAAEREELQVCRSCSQKICMAVQLEHISAPEAGLPSCLPGGLACSSHVL